MKNRMAWTPAFNALHLEVRITTPFEIVNQEVFDNVSVNSEKGCTLFFESQVAMYSKMKSGSAARQYIAE